MNGSDYIGIYCAASDGFVLVPDSIRQKERDVVMAALGVEAFGARIGGSDLIGLLARANSNGIVLSNLALEEEIRAIRRLGLGNVAVLESDLNAVGSNILANDRIAIINEDYSREDERRVSDVLGVEAIRWSAGGFKTVGANNILTNSGLVVNNRSTDDEKRLLDSRTGFDSVRSTANTGAVAIGLSVAANRNGIVAGEATTGYELARIVGALER